METLMAGKNNPSTQVQIGNTWEEDDLMKLFDQFSSLMSPVSDWLELDTAIIINEASLQGKRVTYQVTIQTLITTALLDTWANIPVVLKKFFRSLAQTPQLLKVYMHKVTSASGANLGPVGQCDIIFRLGNKQFFDRFIVVQDLQRNLI